MRNNAKPGNAGLDLEGFFSAHSEHELLALRNVIDKLISEKKKTELCLPLHIFSSGISPGEAIAKYLKENKKLRISTIADKLGRSPNSIWLNYNRAAEKMPKKFSGKSRIEIPVSIFRTGHSYLEALTVYLRDSLNMSNKDSALKLNKSEQVLSMAYNRAKSKK